MDLFAIFIVLIVPCRLWLCGAMPACACSTRLSWRWRRPTRRWTLESCRVWASMTCTRLRLLRRRQVDPWCCIHLHLTSPSNHHHRHPPRRHRQALTDSHRQPRSTQPQPTTAPPPRNWPATEHLVRPAVRLATAWRPRQRRALVLEPPGRRPPTRRQNVTETLSTGLL